jgi:hypothetical protein
METTEEVSYCDPIGFLANKITKRFNSNPQVRLISKAIEGKANATDFLEAIVPIKALMDKLADKKFQDQLMRNIIYIGVKWTAQKPVLISVITEIIQIMDNVFGLINIEITALISWACDFVKMAYEYLSRAAKVSKRGDILDATAESHGDLLESEHLTGICAAVATVLSGVTLGLGASCFQDGWKTLKKFADHGRSVANFERGAVAGWHVVEYVFNSMKTIFEKITNHRALRKAEADFKKHDINIVEYLNQVDAYIDPLLSFEDMTRIRTMAQAKHLKNIGNKIEGLLAIGDITTTAVARQIVLKKITDFRTYLAGNNFAAEDLKRAIPYGIMVAGGPGCGKSLFGNLLAEYLTQPGVVSGHPYKANDIYWWNPAKKFMDNYVQQAIVVIDDDGALKDVAGCESGDHKKLLMFSNGAYYPEFARLEDKGRAFTSEVIISSSNLAYPEYNSLRDNEAMWRRRNLLFWQYSDGPCQDANNWRFRRMRPIPTNASDPGYIDTDILTVDQVLAEIIFGLESWRASESTDIKDVKVDNDYLQQLRSGKVKLPMNGKVEPIKTAVRPPPPTNKNKYVTAKAQYHAPPPSPPREEEWVHEYDPDQDPWVIGGQYDPWERMASMESMLQDHLNQVPEAYEEEWHPPPYEQLHVTSMVTNNGYDDALFAHNGTRMNFYEFEDFYGDVGTAYEELAIDGFMEKVGNRRSRAYYRAILLFLKEWQNFDVVDAMAQVKESRHEKHERMKAEFFNSTGDQSDDEEIVTISKSEFSKGTYEDDDDLLLERENASWCRNYSAVLKNICSRRDEPFFLQEKDWADTTFEWICVCLQAIAMIALVVGSYKLIKWAISKPDLEVAPEALNYDNRTAIKQQHVYHPESLKYDSNTAIQKPLVSLAQGCANKNTCAMLYGTIKNNTYFMTLKGAGRTFMANAVMIKGTDLVFAKHSLAAWEEYDPATEIELTLTKDTISYRESIQLGSFRKHPTKDFVWVRMTLGKIHAHKSLLNWIAPEEDLGAKINGFDCATVSIDLWDQERTISFHYGTSTMKKVRVSYESNSYMVAGYSSSIIGGEGLCGRLLVDTTSGLDRPIVGLHVAGLNAVNNSVFYPISQKDIAIMEGDVETATIQATDFDDIAHKHKELFLETNLTNVKAMARIPCPGYKNYAIVSSRLEVVPRYETSFRKTILHDKVMENVHAPSPLSLRNPNIDPEVRKMGISPQELAESKYTKETRPFPKKLLAFAKEGLTLALMPMEYKDWTVMDLDKGLNGDGGSLQAMNMHSSPGTEYQKISDNHKGKHAFVRRTAFRDTEGKLLPESEQKWEVRDEEHKPTGVGGVRNRGKYLLDDLERIETDLKEGREVFSPASSSMKDETLPKEKVRIAKVRLFMTLAMSITILTRRYFGAFLAASVAYCTKIPLAIGVDAYGPQWTVLYDRMNKWGGKCIAADFKSFDSQADGECMLNAAEAISDIYDRKHGAPDPIGRRVRMGLVYIFIHTYVVCRNLMYRKAQGIPSGVPVTAPLNSCVNIQYLVMCVKDLTDKAGYNYSVNQIMAMVEILVYGDDFVISIHPLLEGIITFRTMRDWFAQYLITITPESKNGEDYDYRKLANEVTFLKRKWCPEPGDSTKVRAPIEKETIAGIVNWMRKGHPPVEMMKSLIEENYLQELFHHGRDTYEEGLKALNDALQRDRAEGLLHLDMTDYYANDYNERHVEWLRKFN